MSLPDRMGKRHISSISVFGREVIKWLKKKTGFVSSKKPIELQIKKKNMEVDRAYYTTYYEGSKCS
jgi:hypothetical protein